MGIEKHISELLYRYNCVVIPNFGAFLTQSKSAYIGNDNYTFHPPTKSLSFNQLLTNNDGLLVSYMAEIEKTSYDEMLLQINHEVKNWKLQLEEERQLTINNIGKIVLNEEGNMLFTPTNEVNYLTSSFGLPSFISKPITREVLKEEVVALEEKIPFIITPEQREQTTSIRPYLKYAAVILLALSTGFTAFQFINKNWNNRQVVQQQAQEQVSKNIQEATFFSARPMELPPLTIGASKIEKTDAIIVDEPMQNKAHNIIAGAFKFKENATKKIAQLQAKGYNAFYLGINAHGLHQVCYDSFTNPKEALQFLRKVKQSESAEAWMLSIK